MEKVLFCKIASMIWYKGVCQKDKPFNGGKYPRETGTCGEDRNFMPVHTETGEKCFGFVEPKRGRSGYTNQLRVENIRGANARHTDDSIDDICVIWCATTDLNETSVIGWYKSLPYTVKFKNLNLRMAIRYGTMWKRNLIIACCCHEIRGTDIYGTRLLQNQEDMVLDNPCSGMQVSRNPSRLWSDC